MSSSSSSLCLVCIKSRVQAQNWKSRGNIYDIREYAHYIIDDDEDEDDVGDIRLDCFSGSTFGVHGGDSPNRVCVLVLRTGMCVCVCLSLFKTLHSRESGFS